MPNSGVLPPEAASASVEFHLPAQRLLSLDVFRGATVASMILVNDPGSWSAVYPPLEHAAWNGWTFTDTVFPFFLWIAGVAMTLSFARRMEQGASRRQLLLHSLRRAAILFTIGLLLHLVPHFRFATMRIPGVLQRIAVCYLAAAGIYLYTRLRGQIVWILALLAVYWMLMTLVPVPGYGPGLVLPVGNFAQWVDSRILAGHMWYETKVWDPEGIVSTLPAIATTLFGILTGHLLRARMTPAEKTAWMLVGGNVLIFAGNLMNPFLPINKSLWTSSYAVLMAGLAMVVFGICYWVVDVQGWRRFVKPFVIFGSNAVGMFVLSGALSKTLGELRWEAPIYRTVFQPLAEPQTASLLYAICFVLVCYLVAWGLYRRRWFIRF
jgi:predicted acyltransferase